METHRQVKRGFALVERLRNDPASRWRAQELGGEEHLYWSVDTYLLAALVDAVHAQLKGKKLSEGQKVGRPKTTRKKRKKFNASAPASSMDLRGLLPEGW